MVCLQSLRSYVCAALMSGCSPCDKDFWNGDDNLQKIGVTSRALVVGEIDLNGRPD
jgi:hypothetical protein